jgi:L-alanine-DL-glutamate epimerase-like enolase superfamily enzyme
MAVGMGNAAVRTVEVASESGVTHFKIKIMPGHTSHVAEIRCLFPDAIIGVDANGSFDSSTISEILAVGGLDISFVEQPTLAAADPAVQMLRDAGFTVFVDESIRSVETAERALAITEVSGVVVKPGRLGWSGSVEVVRLARAAGKLWRASGLLESGVGRSFTLALAAADDAFVSDVAPGSRFFAYDITQQMVEDGRLIVPTGPGTGLDVDTDIVQDQAVEVITLSGSAIPNLD